MAPGGMPKIDKIVRKHQDGAIINLFVTPGAQTIHFPAGFNRWRRCIEIKVKSPAKDNQANKEVITTVASFLNKPVEDVLIVSGVKNRSKTILVKGISTDTISERLRKSLNEL
jgi:uncharacterized protein (TIGR00251 family)